MPVSAHSQPPNILTPFDLRERTWMRAILIATALLLVLPYLWAWAITPPGMVYGGLLFSADDQNVHLAWARQAAQGHFFFRDLFTTESLETRPLFTNIFCFTMGLLSRVTFLPLIWVYHALRVLFAMLTLVWFHRLCRRLNPDWRVRIVAVSLAAFSMGAGWLMPLLPRLIFIDRPDGALMMPEAWTFASAFVFPLFIASTALLVLTYDLTLQARADGNPKTLGKAALAAFLLANIHTYDALPLIAVLLLWSALSRRENDGDNAHRRARWMAPLATISGACLPLIYQVVVFRGNREFQIKALTPTLPPLRDANVFALHDPNLGWSILSILASYGPLFVAAIVGAFVAWKLPRARLMIIWVIVTLIFIYAPVSFARKMIEGLHLPLCFLGALGLIFLLQGVSPVVRRVVVIGFVVMMSGSTVRFIGWCVSNGEENNQSRVNNFFPMMPPLYLSQGDAGALQFLASSPREGAVLCWPTLGNYAPQATGRAVYAGHWAETLHLGAKLGRVRRFYHDQITSDEALAFLRDNHIAFVIVGQYEVAEADQSHAARPSMLGASLPLVWRQHNTSVYEVPPASSTP